MFYVTVDDFRGFYRGFTEVDENTLSDMLREASTIVYATGTKADEDVITAVVCRMVKRALNVTDGVPIGSTQGSMSALGYTQSWTLDSNGSAGEIYLSKLEKKMLGLGNRVGSYSPLEDCND